MSDLVKMQMDVQNLLSPLPDNETYITFVPVLFELLAAEDGLDRQEIQRFIADFKTYFSASDNDLEELKYFDFLVNFSRRVFTKKELYTLIVEFAIDYFFSEQFDSLVKSLKAAIQSVCR